MSDFTTPDPLQRAAETLSNGERAAENSAPSLDIEALAWTLAREAVDVSTRNSVATRRRLLAEAFTHILRAALDDAQQPERDQVMPGAFECAKCGLVLQATIMSVADGIMAPDSAPQQCANGCGPMWPLTYKKALRDLMDRTDGAQQTEAKGSVPPWWVVPCRGYASDVWVTLWESARRGYDDAVWWARNDGSLRAMHWRIVGARTEEPAE
jgi:hypothetical protein